jgi:hypothetical protein
MYKMGLPVLTEEFVLMNEHDFMTICQAADKWNITVRRAQVLCAEGRIEGAFRLGRAWIIPRDAEKPADARIKSGKYVKVKDGGANED